jgi:ADP-ribose pyrophosphatase YjhB (NUDIX family)
MRKRAAFEINYFYCPSCKTKLEFRRVEKKDVLACPKCSFIFWNNPKPVVSALCVQDSKVLLIKRGRKSGSYKYYWALPGGMIDYLEKTEKALDRELSEETGCKMEDCQIYDAHLIVYSPRGLHKKSAYTSIDIVYLVKLKKINDISLLKYDPSETANIAFFPVDKLPKKIAFGHREIIYKFFRKQ